MAEYVLARGGEGQRRLEILNEAMWPSSRRLLHRAGLRPGMSFLDVGCAAGELTARVADLGVDAHGIDYDRGFADAAAAHYPEILFHCLDVFDLAALSRTYDFVYARYLLSHLDNPQGAIEAMLEVTRPGGMIVIEDTDFDLHTAEPRIDAFERYLDLYKSVLMRRGGNPVLGRRLFALAQASGVAEVVASVNLSVFTEGAPKHISSLTLSGIREGVVRERLATEGEIALLLQELHAWESEPSTLVSIAGTHQIYGRKK